MLLLNNIFSKTRYCSKKVKELIRFYTLGLIIGISSKSAPLNMV